MFKHRLAGSGFHGPARQVRSSAETGQQIDVAISVRRLPTHSRLETNPAWIDGQSEPPAPSSVGSLNG